MSEPLPPTEKRLVSLKWLCAQDAVEDRFPAEGFLFWFRWENGEIADDLLEERGAEMTYRGEEGPVLFEGKEYTSSFYSDTVGDVQSTLSGLRRRERPPVDIAVRYYLEFDAFLVPGPFRVGGFWEWGGGSRGQKREPQEFYDHWSKQ